jgi:hypothetical protein
LENDSYQGTPFSRAANVATFVRFTVAGLDSQRLEAPGVAEHWRHR